MAILIGTNDRILEEMDREGSERNQAELIESMQRSAAIARGMLKPQRGDDRKIKAALAMQRGVLAAMCPALGSDWKVYKAVMEATPEQLATALADAAKAVAERRAE